MKRRRSRGVPFFIAGFALFLSISSQVGAQEPPGENAGAQAERFKKKIEQEKEELRRENIRAPEIEIEKKQEGQAVEGISFTLKEVKITGAAIFKPEDFVFIYQPHLNKKLTFKDLEAITEKIKAKYTEKGYLSTTVYIPEQEIAEGKIEIRIAEGKMGKLSIEGNKWFSSSLIEKYFHAKKNEILNIKTLQRDLLRLNQNPDLEIKAVVSPGEEPASSDITLKVKDRSPWHFGAGFDNQGTRLSGKSRESFLACSSNITGNLDSLYMNTLFSSGSFGESVSYVTPLNTYGTKFGFDITWFDMELGKEYKPFDITGNTQIYTPHILWELYLSEDHQVNADLGIDIKSIKKKMAGAVTVNDQLRLPYFGLDFTKVDSSGSQTAFSPKVTFGIEDFLGASCRNHPSASREDTGGSFFKYEQALSRIQRMPFESYLSLRSRFQAASHTLPSSEQLQLGGANSVRGYPEGDYLCDWGGNLNLDWVFPFYLIPKDWKMANSSVPLRHQVEPVFFADAGGGKLKKVISGERRDKFLGGIGGGFRVQLGNKLFLRLGWAKHLGDDPTSNSGPSTFYLTFQSEVW